MRARHQYILMVSSVLGAACPWFSFEELVVAVFGILATTVRAHSQQYVKISAEIELINYVTNETRLPRRTYSVECITGTNEWRIDNNFPLNGKESWYFDGTNVYHRLQFAPGTESLRNTGSFNPTHKIPAEALFNVTVSIIPSPGGHPLGNLGVNIPWLAFCSGSYLRRPGRNLPLPTAEIQITPTAFAYTDETRSFQDTLGLPEAVVLATSKSRYASSLADERLLRHPRVLDARVQPSFGLPNGAVQFRYETAETTNVLGWIIPRTFTYIHYEFDQDEHPVASVGGEGRLIAAQPSAKPQNVFVEGGSQTVVDYRFRHRARVLDGIVYSATNITAAPPTNDSALLDNFDRRARRTEPLRSPRAKTVRWALATGVGLAYFQLRQMKTKNR